MSSNVPPAGPRKRKTASPIKHGTNYAYTGRGCRCRACRDAHNEYQRNSGRNVRQGEVGERKRRWDRENRGYCACGARCSRGHEQCEDCRRRADRDARDLRRGDIAQLYCDGLPLREIAQQLWMTVNALGTVLAHMRADGWDLPYRYGAYERSRVHANDQA